MDNKELLAGDIRYVRTADGSESQMSMVVEVNDDNTVSFCLVHAYPEMATDSDLIVPNILPYTLVVQSDLMSVAWASQFGELVTALPMSWAEWPLTRKVPDNCWTGHHLAGSLDCRWAFKEEQGDTLAKLSNDCISVLLKEKYF